MSVSHELTTTLIGQFIETDWAGPCHELLEAVKTDLVNATQEAITTQVSLTRYVDLKKLLEKKIGQLLQSLAEKAKAKLDEYIKDEIKVPFSQNDDLASEIMSRRGKWVQQEIIKKLNLSNLVQGSQIDATIVKNTIESVFAESRDKSIDLYMAEDTEIILDVYGQHALRRFSDNVPTMIGNFLKEFPSHVQSTLSALTAKHNIDTLIADTPHNKAKYKNLKDNLDDLDASLQLLATLG